ncbi:MAG: GGDEF domain-containing protein [Pseudomonadota bacterium]
MTKPRNTDEIGLDGAALDLLMPMHILVGASGRVLRAGRTLDKLCAPDRLADRPVQDVLDVRRPGRITGIADLLTLSGSSIRLALKGIPGQRFKGTVVPLPADAGALVDLSFGFTVVNAVRRYGLTVSDFAVTGLTAEMLYLSEVSEAAYREMACLAERLHDSKVAAEEKAFTDALTGLKNRRAMDQMLNGLTQTADREAFSLMHVDLDHFKRVNDIQGHAAGDHVLLHVADVLTHETRAGDLVARVGGDEFILIFRNCNDLVFLNRIALRIIRQLQRPVMFKGRSCRISASIGISVSSHYDVPNAWRMLNDADEATYVSKQRGRARYTISRSGESLAVESSSCLSPPIVLRPSGDGTRRWRDIRSNAAVK